jgi:hypothetical protein
MRNEVDKIEKQIIEICWFMRGSISYNEALNLSYSTLKNIRKHIKEHIELVKKTGMPLI